MRYPLKQKHLKTGTVAFNNISNWVDWTGDTGYLTTTGTNSITGNYSLEVSQAQDMSAVANFSGRPSRITYKSYYEWSSDGYGDSSRDSFEDGQGNRIFSFQHLPPFDSVIDNEIVANNKDNILIDGVSNGVVRDYEVNFDWQNEEVFVSVDGNSGNFSFVNSPADTDFRFQFTADADRWDFLRRYDDIKFEY